MKKCIYVAIIACMILFTGCSSEEFMADNHGAVNEDAAVGFLDAEGAAARNEMGGENYLDIAEDADYWWDWADGEDDVYWDSLDDFAIPAEPEESLGMGGGVLAQEAAAAPSPAAGDEPAPETGGEYEQLSNIREERRVIRNAEVRMEVDSLNIAYNNIVASAARLGGFEASRNMVHGERNSGFVSAVIRLPANRLDEFLREIEQAGRIISSNITSDDITNQYFASQIRVGNLERTLERYYEFLARADSFEEQLSVQRQIDNIIWEIEQITGRINMWGNLVAYSNVSIDLRRLPDPGPCGYCDAYPCECVPCEYCERYPCICALCQHCGEYEHQCVCVLCEDCGLYPCICAPEPEPRRVVWRTVPMDDMLFNIMQGFASSVSAITRITQHFLTWYISNSPVLIPITIIIIILLRPRLKRCAAALKEKIVELKNGKKEENKEKNDETPE